MQMISSEILSYRVNWKTICANVVGNIVLHWLKGLVIVGNHCKKDLAASLATAVTTLPTRVLPMGSLQIQLEYVTRFDKTSLIAQKHTCSLNLIYLLLHLSQSDSVSFIRIASNLFTSEQNFIWILALQTTLWNFKHVKLGQILMGYKTGFVRPGHIYGFPTGILHLIIDQPKQQTKIVFVNCTLHIWWQRLVISFKAQNLLIY